MNDDVGGSGRHRFRGRHFRRSTKKEGGEPEYIEIDPSELEGVLAAPSWLRDFGLTSWLLVGIALMIAGAVWLMSLTSIIVLPVITAAVIASVAAPVVGWLSRHHVPRPAGAILLLLAVVALAVAVVVVVLAGITSELSSINSQLADAKETISGWLQDIGVDPSQASDASNEASSTTTAAGSALLSGLAAGIDALSSLVFFLAMTLLSLVFLLADGPKIRAWGERHMGVPIDVGRTITQRILGSLRGYFLGVSIVAAFNAVVVVIGALILGVPLAATLGIVTFFAAFVPYLGAWTAAAFSVLIALGGAGPDAAAGMVVVQLLANSVLQQMVQPIAMGAALGIHPLAVLIVTIGGGALFGGVGLILAAPLTAAAVRISADLAKARSAEDAGLETGGLEPAQAPA